MEEWGFIWIMLVLKIPLVALLWLVWWSVRAIPDPESQPDDEGGDGGTRRPVPTDPRHPRGPRRRGPHGDPALPSPPRTRVPARARDRAVGPPERRDGRRTGKVDGPWTC